ncbi:MAG TPA: DNA polymerase III subunit alpha, partial [Egibacteraceae bacterium]|nr:DNA polymerase III subunit alpha [Egibacteraceae bacterium]
MGGFAHLAATTAFSLRDGVIRPRELAVATWERGMDTIGIADRGGLYGAVRFAEACAVVGIRPIFGADLALAHDAARPGWADRRAAPAGGAPQGPGSGPGWLEGDPARVTLVASTQDGYANLCRLVTDHHLGSPRGEPHATWAQLERWAGRGGLFVLLGDDSPAGRLLDAGQPDAAAAETHRWMDLAGPSGVLVGITHHLAPHDDTRARARFALADRLGLRAVAHQAPRYLEPADARVADVMEAIRGQVPLDPRHTRRRNDQGYLKNPGEMHAVFAERPDALRNAAEVADRCRADPGLGTLRVPDFRGSPESTDAGAELRSCCEAGLAERYARPARHHRDLLEAELAMIARLGLAPYFLTVAEIVERIRDKQIMVACRGSAAGSLVCYCLRISDVDPVAHDLAFERFMNPYRDELPDIDLDVESARREDIYADLLARYGEDRVACVCMVETFQARMAIREVGKAIGLPAVEVDAIAKAFPHIRARDVRTALDSLPELSGLHLDRKHLRLLFTLVERLDGLPRHVALHPSGVLLADRTLRDFVPLERSANGFAMAQFDKDDVEALGLCKLDVLAVRMLSSMAHCVEEVRRTRGEDIDFAAVPWDDAPTYELIRSTRTLGMFQIESPGQRELIGKFQPEHVGDLVVDISLFRPGPVKGDMVGPFLQRRIGKSEVVYPHPLLERALGETYGVIVYHEQVMRCVAAVTGCDLSTADLVRRRLGDPDEAGDLREWVLDGCRERGIDEATATSLWHALAQFASFGFCKAHAAAFAVPTYRSAWLKRHYLPEFVAGLLTHDPGMYPRRLLLEDARQLGVCVLPLDVNRSAREYRVERLPAGLAFASLGVVRGPSHPSSASGYGPLVGSGRTRRPPLTPSGEGGLDASPPGRVRPFSPLRPGIQPPSDPP